MYLWWEGPWNGLDTPRAVEGPGYFQIVLADTALYYHKDRGTVPSDWQTGDIGPHFKKGRLMACIITGSFICLQQLWMLIAGL